MTIKMSPYQSFIATDYGPALYKGKNLVGEPVGGYLVQGLAGYTPSAKGLRPNWAVVCISCSTLFIISKYNVLKNSKGCVSCAAKSAKGNASPHWKGSGNISGYFVAKLQTDRKSRTLEIDVTAKYLDKLWTEQRGRCAYTGWLLTLEPEEQTASLDRVDSSKGYTRGNVQFVHKDVNKMKWDLPESRFLEICTAIGNRWEE